MERAVLGLNQVILTYLSVTSSGLKAGAGTPVIINGNKSLGGSNHMREE